MIPLRVKVAAPNALGPHVIRVPADGVIDELTGTKVVDSGARTLELETISGPLMIEGLSLSDCLGDVLMVMPRQGIAHRLIRASSKHNTLLITEQCDQLCLMCSQPPKKQHYDLMGLFKSAIRLAPDDSVIGISGGEPLLYKAQVFDLLQSSLERRPDLKFHVLTNAQHFGETDIQTLRELGGNRVLWGIPIYSHLSSQHDEIVAKSGAWSRLIQSFDVLARSGAAIELRTVIMKPNHADLPDLSEFVATNLPFISQWSLMQMESIGFARKNWDQLFFDHSSDFSTIAAAVDTAGARGLNVQLFNFPLCTVPRQYHRFTCRSISDWKQKYLDECTGCLRQADCAGFFEWYDPRLGFGGIRAIC